VDDNPRAYWLDLYRYGPRIRGIIKCVRAHCHLSKPKYIKKTPAECREQLIDGLMKTIVPGLKCRLWGYMYPFNFIKLSSSDVHRIVTEMDTSTVQFGRFVNDIRKEFYMERSERDLVEIMWNLFWWPAVDNVWPLQCFEIRHTFGDEPVNDLYLLARTGPDEWVGLQTKINYAPIED
jgi:hypothetical protein